MEIDMKTRIITGVVAFLILVPFLIFAHTPAYTVLAAILGLIGVFEMLRCQKLAKNLKLLIPTLTYAILVPVIGRHLSMGHDFMTVFTALTSLYMLVCFAMAVFSKGKIEFVPTAAAVASCVYVVLGFSCLLVLRDWSFGGYLFLLPFLSAWVSDTAAYFTGRAFGKNKLIPDVSPNKTVEGAIGGLVVTAIFMLVYGCIVRFALGVGVNLIGLFLLGVALSAVSMVGDLIASLIKRHYNIKDYSHIFPGHGGVLDRFDSVLATAPMTFIVITVFTRSPLFFELL